LNLQQQWRIKNKNCLFTIKKLFTTKWHLNNKCKKEDPKSKFEASFNNKSIFEIELLNYVVAKHIPSSSSKLDFLNTNFRKQKNSHQNICKPIG
jgi:hypothetical protein